MAKKPANVHVEKIELPFTKDDLDAMAENLLTDLVAKASHGEPAIAAGGRLLLALAHALGLTADAKFHSGKPGKAE